MPDLTAAIAATQAATAALETLAKSLSGDDNHDGHQAVTAAL
jgi:hypothetical protein